MNRYVRRPQLSPQGWASAIVSPLPARARFRHPELGMLDLKNREEVLEYAEIIDDAPDTSDLVRLVAEGECLDPDTDEPKPEKVAAHIRALLLGTDTAIRRGRIGRVSDPEWLIKDVWPRGTSPHLSGNSKAGKSFLLLEVVNAILVPGHLFLGKFSRGDLRPGDLGRGIVWINTEHPAEDIERWLEPLGSVMLDVGRDQLVSARSLVTVYHLRELEGGVLLGDLFSDETFDMWRRVLLHCEECEGEDNDGPLAVLFDNGTAVLRALRMNVQEHNGELFERFRMLLAEAEMVKPSGLYVSHSRDDGQGAYGGTLSSAVSDGEWWYARTGRSPRSPRIFTLIPRGDTATVIDGARVVKENGRLLIGDRARGAGDVVREPDISDDEAAEERVRELLRENPKSQTVDITGRGADGKRRRAALRRLEERGEVVMEREGRQTMLWSLTPVSDTHDTDTHDTLMIDLSSGQ